MLPRIVKEEKYQYNEERSNCIRSFIWGSDSHEDFFLLPHAYSNSETCPQLKAEPAGAEKD